VALYPYNINWDYIPGRGTDVSLFHSAYPDSGGLFNALYSEAVSMKVRRAQRETDNSPLSIAEHKNASSYPSTPPIRLNFVVHNKNIRKLYHNSKSLHYSITENKRM
jgi:hypothetical protein